MLDLGELRRQFAKLAAPADQACADAERAEADAATVVPDKPVHGDESGAGGIERRHAPGVVHRLDDIGAAEQVPRELRTIFGITHPINEPRDEAVLPRQIGARDRGRNRVQAKRPDRTGKIRKLIAIGQKQIALRDDEVFFEVAEDGLDDARVGDVGLESSPTAPRT